MNDFYSARDLEMANMVKELIIGALHNEGKLLPGLDPEELCKQYVVIVSQRTWYGKLWAKVWGIPEEGMSMFRVAKMVSNSMSFSTESSESVSNKIN